MSEWRLGRNLRTSPQLRGHSQPRTTVPYRCACRSHSPICVQFFERSAFRVLAPLYGLSL